MPHFTDAKKADDELKADVALETLRGICARMWKDPAHIDHDTGESISEEMRTIRTAIAKASGKV